MKFPSIAAFVSLILLSSGHVFAAPKLAPSVDGFIESIQAEISGPQPFFNFASVIDPWRHDRPASEAVRDTLRTMFRNRDAKFDVLYRREDSDAAETIIGAIWADADYAFLAFVLHKRPDGWFPIAYSLQSSHQNILPYR